MPEELPGLPRYLTTERGLNYVDVELEFNMRSMNAYTNAAFWQKMVVTNLQTNQIVSEHVNRGERNTRLASDLLTSRTHGNVCRLEFFHRATEADEWAESAVAAWSRTEGEVEGRPEVPGSTVPGRGGAPGYEVWTIHVEDSLSSGGRAVDWNDILVDLR